MTPQWRALVVRGALSEALRVEIEAASGAYAIREKDSHRVVYVGESSRGRMWKTMLRHFQAPESFRKVRETGIFATRAPERYEVAGWATGDSGADSSSRARQPASWSPPRSPWRTGLPTSCGCTVC